MSAAPFHALNCASKLTVVSRFGRNGVIVLGRIVHPASFLVAPRPSECYWAVGWDASVDGQVPWVWLSQYTVPVMRCEHAILTQDGTRQAELDFLLLGSRAQGDFTRARCVLKLRFGPSCAGATRTPASHPRVCVCVCIFVFWALSNTPSRRSHHGKRLFLSFLFHP